MSTTGAGTAGRRLGRYHLSEPLGGGPTGEVFRAKVYGVAGFERQFAVKRFHPEFVKNPDVAARVASAARSYGSLEHPRIARLHEYGVAGGETFTAVELVEGIDLARLVAATWGRGEPLVVGAATALVAQAARAVGYAHGRGICHLGLCPTNLVCTPAGDVKITDFGMLPPRLPRRPEHDDSLAARIPYLAPELLAGEQTSAGTDVFQLGAVAYEAFTGERAFRGEDSLEVAQRIMAGQLADPALPRSLHKVLMRALARSPFERFPDARAMADAIDAAVRATPLPGGPRELAAAVRATRKQLDEMQTQQVSGAVRFPMPSPPRPDTVKDEPGPAATAPGVATPPAPAQKGPAVPPPIPGARPEPRRTVMGVGAPRIPRPDEVGRRQPPAASAPIAPSAFDKPPSPMPKVPRPQHEDDATTEIHVSSRGLGRTGAATPTPTGPTSPGAEGAAAPPAAFAPTSGGSPSPGAVASDAPPSSPAGTAAPPDRPPPRSGLPETQSEISAPTGGEGTPPAPPPPPAAASGNGGSALPLTAPATGAHRAQGPPRRRRRIPTGLWVGAILLAAASAGVGGYFLYASRAGDGAPDDEPTPTAVAPPPPDAAPPPDAEPPPDAPPPELVIESQPEGAKVYLDGTLKGKTPLELEPTADHHRLALILPGYELHTSEIEGHGTMSIELQEVTPPGGPAGIKVRCHKKNRYYVTVDGHDVGQLCPTERIGADLGKHVVEIYDPVTDTRREFRIRIKQTRISFRVYVD